MKNIKIAPIFKNYESVDFTTGVLNIAPTKISGQYKIVISLDNKLYLDDYCGRRVPIDLNTPFLHQVSNFLSGKSVINDTTKFRYGGFENSGIKSYHIPMYLGNFNFNHKQFPRFFCIANVPNTTINDSIENIILEPDDVRDEKLNIYRYGTLLKVVDFERLGITKIFDEIISEQYFNYPVYFNFEDNNIKLFGQGIKEQYPVVKTIDITNNMANQTYLEVLNNKILNEFYENDMFYPRFLNIECEFDFESQTIPYNNFTGFISYANNIIESHELYDSDTIIHGYIINLLDENSNWKQIKLNEKIDLDIPIKEKSYDFQINEINTQPYKFRFRTSTCYIDDNIQILDSNDKEIIDFQIESDDIKTDNLFENWYHLCKKFTKQANKEFKFSVKSLSKYFVEISIIYEPLINSSDNYKLVIPSHYVDCDKLDINVPDVNENRFKYQQEETCVNLVSANNYSDQLLNNIFTSKNIANKKIDDS